MPSLSLDEWAASLFAAPTDPATAARDAFDERCAILEFDAGLPRAEAERQPAAELRHP